MVLSVSSWVWLALVVVFAVLEAVTIGLVCIWFAAGAVAALITSAFTSSAPTQIIVFLIVSFVALAVTRPYIKKRRLDQQVPTNADMNIGRKAVVIADITPDVPGRVKLDGVDWIARSVDVLHTGELCVVKSLDSATLTVRAETGGVAKLV
ncbi:MAG: NfeD family protein [Ruthenibacterium sp.]